MNITIDTSAAQKSTVLSSAKMTGVSKTSEKSEAKTAQTTAKKYDTLDLSENAVQYLAKTENENTSTESGTEEQTDNAVTEAATQLVSESTDSNYRLHRALQLHRRSAQRASGEGRNNPARVQQRDGKAHHG